MSAPASTNTLPLSGVIPPITTIGLLILGFACSNNDIDAFTAPGFVCEG